MKKEKQKNLGKLSLFLAAFLLMVSFIPANAFANAVEKTPMEGMQGNVEWKVDEEGILTFSPKADTDGTFYNTSADEETRPWLMGKDVIKGVVFNEGVKLAPEMGYFLYGLEDFTVDFTNLDFTNNQDYLVDFVDLTEVKELILVKGMSLDVPLRDGEDVEAKYPVLENLPETGLWLSNNADVGALSLEDVLAQANAEDGILHWTLEVEEPVVETDEPVVETDEPETTEPVTETDEPVVETDEPVVETDEPETTEPGAETIASGVVVEVQEILAVEGDGYDVFSGIRNLTELPSFTPSFPDGESFTKVGQYEIRMVLTFEDGSTKEVLIPLTIISEEDANERGLEKLILNAYVPYLEEVEDADESVKPFLVDFDWDDTDTVYFRFNSVVRRVSAEEKEEFIKDHYNTFVEAHGNYSLTERDGEFFAIFEGEESDELVFKPVTFEVDDSKYSAEVNILFNLYRPATEEDDEALLQDAKLDYLDGKFVQFGKDAVIGRLPSEVFLKDYILHMFGEDVKYQAMVSGNPDEHLVYDVYFEEAPADETAETPEAVADGSDNAETDKKPTLIKTGTAVAGGLIGLSVISAGAAIIALKKKKEEE